MADCPDCGTRISDGFCPNCHESAFIVETQSDFLPEHLSDEFVSDVEDQRRAAKVMREFAALPSMSPQGDQT